LSGSELLVQSVGDDIIVSLHTQCIDCEETGNIVYEEFYNKLSASQGQY